MKIKILSLFIVLLTVNSISRTDDGMWLPHQMKMLNLQKEGLQMNPDDLFKEDGTKLSAKVLLRAKKLIAGLKFYNAKEQIPLGFYFCQRRKNKSPLAPI